MKQRSGSIPEPPPVPASLPEGWALDPAVEQVGAEFGYWWVITDAGLRTAWNGEANLVCPVCSGDVSLMPDCRECAGRGRVDHVPYCERPWDEVIPNLWLGGHDCQPQGAPPNGDCRVQLGDFDVVVSLYHRGFDWDVGTRGWEGDDSVERIHFRMADADLDPDHHTHLDDIVEKVVDRLEQGLKVLVRCQAGLNRSSLVVGLVLLRRGWSVDEALARMREVRSPYVLFNTSFVAHLRDVEASLKQVGEIR